jgi:hypothetical protein
MSGLASLYIPSSFSIKHLGPGREVLVLAEQQMVTYQVITAEEEATLIIEGEVVIL